MIFEEPKEEEKVEMGYEKEDRYMTEDLEVHIIELPKFKKKNPKIHTKLTYKIGRMVMVIYRE